MKVGVNGAVRDISDLKVGANGAVRAVSEAYIGVNGAVKKVWPTFPVGTVIVLDTVGSGSWECPASGSWNLEIHGGGGSGGGGSYSSTLYGNSGGGGGGSGTQAVVNLTKGTVYDYTVGKGGQPRYEYGNSGEKTEFSTLLSVSGGFRGGIAGPLADGYGTGGFGYGNLATSGSNGTVGRSEYPDGGVGGYGNKNKPTQIYGNGGQGGSGVRSGYSRPDPGEDGAIILTYLG